MRSKPSELTFLPFAACLLIASVALVGLAGPASAGGQYRDRIYADSFGNLVVHSRSGYKRIVVGEGHLARELADYEAGGADDVVYLDNDDDYSVPYECWKPAVLLKGRSYMYGLEDGELPDLPGKWCGLPERAPPGAAIRRVQP
jgi:ABC-type Fe3+-hydroxamate transport system substrate-binding protein